MEIANDQYLSKLHQIAKLSIQKSASYFKSKIVILCTRLLPIKIQLCEDEERKHRNYRILCDSLDIMLFTFDTLGFHTIIFETSRSFLNFPVLIHS